MREKGRHLRLDARIGLGGGDDRRRGQRLAEIEAVSLPPADRFGVKRQMVFDPRTHPRVTPGAERVGNRGGGRPRVQQLEQGADLHAGHGQPSAGGGGGGGDGISDGHEAGPAELWAVQVEQASPDEHAARRGGDLRVGPDGQRGDRPARRLERVEVAEDAEPGVGGGPDEHH